MLNGSCNLFRWFGCVEQFQSVQVLTDDKKKVYIVLGITLSIINGINVQFISLVTIIDDWISIA